MNLGTPKDQNQKDNINKTPSQKSSDDKQEKNNPQSNANKKASMPNFVARTDINEKNFPQKANYFNDKMNSTTSPIIDYFSPSFYFQKYHSPEDMIHPDNNLHNNDNQNYINKSVEQNFQKSPMFDQNFNFSPSNIFNNNKNFIQNSSSNNSFNILKTPNEKSNEEEDGKTLQERIGILLGQNEANNLIYNQKNNNINTNINPLSNMAFLNNNNILNNINNNMNTTNINNNNIQINPNINNTNVNNTNNNQQNEEEPENQEEVYILNLNSEDENDKDIDDDLQNNNSENNMNENDKENNKKITKSEKEKNNIHANIRNNIKEQLNNIINTGENELPSYGGGNMYQNINDNNNNNNMDKNIQIIQKTQMPVLNNINNTTNNIFYPTMNNNIIYSPMNFGYFPYGYYNNQNLIMNNNNNNNNYYPQKIGQFMNMPLMSANNNINNYNNRNNKFTDYKQNNNYNNINNDKNINNFYYNGDQYQLVNNNKNKNNNKNNKDPNLDDKNNYNNNKDRNSKGNNIYTIGPKDLVVTITSNKKKIKRVNPKAYLNESYEYLSHNIFILSKDQAGCRFLQEKIEKDPINATNYFYEAIQPYLPTLMKDPFGNYLVQRIIKNLDDKRIKKTLDIISPSIVDIGINNHGTRVIQFLITFLKTKELQNYFIQIIKPHTINLLRELNGAHIIQKLLIEYPDSCFELYKIIIDNCSFLATHRHGCCVLQKFMDGNYKKLEDDLIKNLINNCLVLITDQFGNYVIQSILYLKNEKYNSEIAKKISDNIPYYSNHRYSSNVVEKCFDFCNEKYKSLFVEKLCSPEIVAELIVDYHGNYVIQKVLQCADQKTKENILLNIIPLIPKIKEVSFGDRLLNKLLSNYPQLININNYNNNIKKKNNNYGYHSNDKGENNEQDKNYKNRKSKK